MNAFANAFVKAGLVKEIVPAGPVDHVKANLEQLANYVPSQADVDEFNSFNPAAELTIDDVKLLEVNSGALFQVLKYDFDTPVAGAMVRGGFSFLTLASFNQIYKARIESGVKLQIVNYFGINSNRVDVLDLGEISGTAGKKKLPPIPAIEINVVDYALYLQRTHK